MPASLRSLSEQVIVITGASSGIGLSTARAAVERGARVVLAARNEEALRRIETELNKHGAMALAVPTDVGNEEAVRRLGEAAETRFGRIDTWVNNAGVTIYGKLTDVSLSDARRLFETNYFGMVNGSIEAVRRMRARDGEPGAIINVASTTADLAVPLQGHYGASKHAIRAFTDALRMEIDLEHLPLSLTLIKPASIHTPYPQHARNYLPEEPKIPSPLYHPSVVADAILHAATHRVRELSVGGSAKAAQIFKRWTPSGLVDGLLEHIAGSGQTEHGVSPQRPEGTLFESAPMPSEGPQELGISNRYVSRTSAYTSASLHPLLAAALVTVAGATVLAALGTRTKR